MCESFERGWVRALRAGGRHQASAKLSDHFFGELGALTNILELQCRHVHATRSHAIVVATLTVLLDDGSLSDG
jgi:hypothetical protein